MTYSTKDIWPGIYGSHQRCLEALQRLHLIETTEATDIDREAYVELLEYRLKTANGEKKAVVRNRLLQIESAGSISDRVATPQLALPPALRAVERLALWMTSHAVVFLTLLGALSIQIHHVAHLVNRVSQDDSLALGYVFGSVSEITALLLTVHQARKSMLIVFAFVQCWINVLYYCQLPDLTIKLTLSALIAFVLYSYSELYTLKQQRLTHTTML